MNELWIWLSIGMQHILDFDGYDHLLFVTLLVLTYPFEQWRKLLILITAFTVGHSMSLALSISGSIQPNQAWVEFLIGLSIFLSALYNLMNYKNSMVQKPWILYMIVSFFGVIHGMGFSYLLKSMLGSEQNVILPLLYFNLGLELGQLIIVLFVIFFSLLLTFIFKWPFKIYKLTIVCIIALISLQIIVTRLQELF